MLRLPLLIDILGLPCVADDKMEVEISQMYFPSKGVEVGTISEVGNLISEEEKQTNQ